MGHAAAAEFQVRLASTPDDLLAAQRLRYEVFVQELGGDGTFVDHDAGLECDQFDPFFDHLLLIDKTRDKVVGVYRLMRTDKAQDAGGYYSEQEYDLTKLKSSGRRLLELGRSCLHAEYRGGTGMYQLWTGLADYIAKHEIEVLFGVASFHGTDIDALAAPLSLLHHRHLAPENLRVHARPESFQNMSLINEAHLDRRATLMQMPSLIKAYLRLGGHVGEGAYVDHTFNTVDVCLIMDTHQLSARHARIYAARTQ
jgi:putative hemolysin